MSDPIPGRGRRRTGPALLGRTAIDVIVVDFVEARPLHRAALEMTVAVTPWVAAPHVQPVDDGGDVRLTGKVPDPAHAQRETQTVAAGRDGAAAASFDLGGLFDRVEAAVPGAEARASLAIHVRFRGVEDRALAVPLGDRRQATAPRKPYVLAVDLGMCIIGHVDNTSAIVWFAFPQPADPAFRYECRLMHRTQTLTPPGRRIVEVERRALTFTSAAAYTTTATFTGLTADRAYYVELRVCPVSAGTGGPADWFTFASGSFRTCDPTATKFTIAFGSCHQAFVNARADRNLDPNGSILGRWSQIAAMNDLDAVLLLGDQIYGDGIGRLFNAPTWLEKYRARYLQQWAYHPVREVLRSNSVYMAIDDHDIVDDFGAIELNPALRNGALRAFDLFQRSHNPGGLANPYHFTFTRGPAAVFVADCRTNMQPGSTHPILGVDQAEDFRRWVRSPEVAAADVVVFAAGVPMALLPTEVIRAAAAEVRAIITSRTASGGMLVGGALGAAVGSAGGPLGTVIGGGAGLILGAVAGHELGQQFADQVASDDTLLLKMDLAERWDRRENQRDLVFVLDQLFDLGAGLVDGRRRLVVILGGDIHGGTTHAIHSLDPRHAANPLALQLTSSSISRPPVTDSVYVEAMRKASDHINVTAVLDQVVRSTAGSFFNDVVLNGWLRPGNSADYANVEQQALNATTAALESETAFTGRPGLFTLDTALGRRYVAEVSAVVAERTFGLLHIERFGAGRTYIVDAQIRGSAHTIDHKFTIDLDAQPIALGTYLRPTPVQPSR